jgi:adenosine deaminase
VREAFGYDDTVMAEFARATINASFAPSATKTRLHREVDAWLADSAPLDSRRFSQRVIESSDS